MSESTKTTKDIVNASVIENLFSSQNIMELISATSQHKLASS